MLDQSALALTIGMGGVILLLLAGTQILDWYWVVLLTLVSLGAGLYRLRSRIPSVYQLAQRIDRRLNLADALSTATFFSSEDAHGDPAIRQRQQQEAENLARTVDVRASVPLKRPRFAYAAVGVTLAALGLFALRYAVTGSLNLQPSLVKVAFDTFFPPQPQLAKAARKQPDRFKSPGDEGSPDAPTTQSDEKPDAEIQPADAPDENNSQAADNSKSAAKDGKQTEPQNDQTGENADKGEKSNNANDADQQDPKDADSNGNKPQEGKQDSKQSSQNDSSSLMDKLRDAMANMMNKMKPSQKQGDQPQQNTQNGKQNGKADKNQKQSAKNQDQKSNSDAQSDQQSDDSDQKSSEARTAEKSTDKNASPDSKSGIGSADGDKTAKEAEQLAAMGKISEILGKRSQNVTGEVMVEVGSSRQQLKTPWAQRQATHVEAGSEIHRDEVPLIYQQFVEQYFEEIHKAPAAAKKDN